MKKRSIYIIVVVSVMLILFCAAFIVYALPWILHPNQMKYARSEDLNAREYKEYYGGFSDNREYVMGMAVAAADGDWDKVRAIASEDRKILAGTYYYNLSNALEGKMADRLMDYYQPFEHGLFIPVNESSSMLAIACSDEVWFQMGEMTMAEHSAMLSMAFSPKHSGKRFYKRLAQINLVTGQNEVAAKYMDLAGWYPDMDSADFQDWLMTTRGRMQKRDFVHSPSDYRGILKGLLESNPANTLAYEYLMCYDIIIKKLDWFVQDFRPDMPNSNLYRQAALIYLATTDSMTQASLEHFGIDQASAREFSDYTNLYGSCGGDMKTMQQRFGKTYMFFFHFAKRNDGAK